jgi:type II secretory ATPase GspE/PulE/Tfp pilus assembly ATPase PilB-like protein
MYGTINSSLIKIRTLMPDIDKRDQIKDMPIKNNIGDVVAYVNNIFKEAVAFDASDIHIEPQEKFLLIRFRQDGDFHLIDKI